MTPREPTLQEAPGTGDAEIDRLRPWFHNIHLPDGRQTSPRHALGDFPRNKWTRIAPHLPTDLTGWTALDIGCNAGFYSVELARRGARVTAMDLDPHYLRQAQWVLEKFGLRSRVTLWRASVYDLLRHPRQFDLVWFMGVLYHLRYPTLGLDLVARATRRLALVQTLTLPGDAREDAPENVAFADRARFEAPGWPRAAFVERRFAGDPTNWWVFNVPGLEAALRSAGLRPTVRCERETWLCEPGARHDRSLDDVLPPRDAGP